MNLYLRLIWLYLSWRQRKPSGLLDEIRTPFRVWPLDLDIFRHMTNSRYLALMDLGRMDLLLRSGSSPIFKKRGWYPVVASETIRFKKSLKLFDRFEIRTRVVGWNDKAFFVEQRFVSRTEELLALALVQVRFLRVQGGSVSVGAILDVTETSLEQRQSPAFIHDWQKSVESQWERASAEVGQA